MPSLRDLKDGLLAGVDLGSNSFHMAIARLDHGEVRIVETLSEKVQLGAGFDDRGRLTEEAQERALACLRKYAQHLKGVEPRRLRVVGTNALRVAKNAQAFLKKAEKVLDHPIEIIAGREEARLIYLGVAHSQPDHGRRLVVDIGGGSTEFIIGERFEPLATESLHMGCVSFTTRFFPDGVISEERFSRAVTVARQEVLVIERSYKELGWEYALGSSGTIKAVRQVLMSMGLAPDGLIRPEGLQSLRRELLKYRHVDEIVLPGVKDDRKAVIPAGLAVLIGLFEELGIGSMDYSDGALREGVLYDMLGRFTHEDVRDRTVQAMQARYHVDVAQADRVRATALQLFVAVAQAFGLEDEDSDLLQRAALLHEVGLAISHSGFHKHGAYLLRYSDMPGFSRPIQERISLLVGMHRRKVRDEQLRELTASGGMPLLLLCMLLRIAVLVHHSRSRDMIPALHFAFTNGEFVLKFPRGWLERNPLTLADFAHEVERAAGFGFILRVES